ncbi:hypothetical protein M885DRAFT_551130 [Pelagophyceae sp. CCMP2097]|nr:hypothetical protein M885DRAFT_551130 [Pelagophyceae sp. CCMP2097]|mmetsp:Transcript_5864/g.18645  ORF Transcript_5864/g.18645 Transcript_5864/m.18645 type:complete len:208 (+) Transcript_5864:118-741(+)
MIMCSVRPCGGHGRGWGVSLRGHCRAEDANVLEHVVRRAFPLRDSGLVLHEAAPDRFERLPVCVAVPFEARAPALRGMTLGFEAEGVGVSGRGVRVGGARVAGRGDAGSRAGDERGCRFHGHGALVSGALRERGGALLVEHRGLSGGGEGAPLDVGDESARRSNVGGKRRRRRGLDDAEREERYRRHGPSTGRPQRGPQARRVDERR